jgi:hypothetical protein
MVLELNGPGWVASASARISGTSAMFNLTNGATPTEGGRSTKTIWSTKSLLTTENVEGGETSLIVNKATRSPAGRSGSNERKLSGLVSIVAANGAMSAG